MTATRTGPLSDLQRWGTCAICRVPLYGYSKRTADVCGHVPCQAALVGLADPCDRSRWLGLHRQGVAIDVIAKVAGCKPYEVTRAIKARIDTPKAKNALKAQGNG